MKSQLRVGFGCVVGLDYTAVYIVAKTLNIEITPAMLHKLQTIEQYEANRKPKGDDDNGRQ